MKLRSFLLVLITAPLAAQAPSAHLGPDGRLIYAQTRPGDHITDFSYAGYMGGGVALPTIPVAETLAPSGQDDTIALQSALNRLAAHATEPRALLLAPGTFHLSAAVNITSSNIVLRGAGPGKTILALTGKPHFALHIGTGETPSSDDEESTPEADTAVTVTQSTTIAPGVYVPSGTLTLPVASAVGFKSGDTIQIDHPITPAYLEFMGMAHLKRSDREEHWIGTHIATERRIASISGNTLMLDVPLTDNYDPKFGGGIETRVRKIPPPHRLTQVGVESLSITCPAQQVDYNEAHFDGILMSAVEDGWLRDLRFEDTTNSVRIEASARRITIDHVDILQRIPVESSAKPFGFSLAGTQLLVMRSSVKGDKLTFAATQAREQGPNVVMFSDFSGSQGVEPHQRWGTGFLVDNVSVHGGFINFINRGIMGSGHGWTMGWGVVWNSSADNLTVQSPPGAINWAIGTSGHRVGKPMPTGPGPKGPPLPEGIFESPNKRVKPDSLYLQQLNERLGPQAVHNIGY